jgi:hypothetical protein
VAVGGPEVLTRREIALLANRATGRSSEPAAVPALLAHYLAELVYPLNRRLHALLHFGAEVAVRDVVAPEHGTRRLAEFFREVLSREAAARPESARRVWPSLARLPAGSPATML